MPSRALRLRPVKSEKEEISWSNLIQDASTTQTIDIVDAVNSPTTAGEVEIGDTVRSVYFEFHFSPEVITTAKVIHWRVLKNPNGLISFGSPATYDPTAKKHILKRGMEMLPRDLAIVFKRIFVLRIPPRLSRFGDGDKLQFQYICTSTEGIDACGIAIYKHFS